MKNFFVLLLKGFVVGLGKIFPGVSGALIAILLNIYEPILNAFVNLKENFWEHSKFLANLGIGIIAAIVLGSNIMLYILTNYRLQSTFLFAGIIISGTTSLFKEIKNSTLNDKLVCIIVIAVFFLISLLELNNIYVDNNQLFSFIMYFISGIFDAIASIVPGISGTAILMSLGTYDTILAALGSAFNIAYLSKNILIIIPFLLGIVIGTYFTSRFITYALKNHHNKSYYCIIGFSFFSVFILLKQTLNTNYTLYEIIFSMLLLVVGYIGSKKMNI